LAPIRKFVAEDDAVINVPFFFLIFVYTFLHFQSDFRFSILLSSNFQNVGRMRDIGAANPTVWFSRVRERRAM